MSRIQRRKFNPTPKTVAKQTQAKQAGRGIEHSTTPKPTPKAKSRKANSPPSVGKTKLPERDSTKIKSKLSITSLKKKHNTPVETTDTKSFLSGLKKK